MNMVIFYWTINLTKNQLSKFIQIVIVHEQTVENALEIFPNKSGKYNLPDARFLFS